MNAPRRSVLPSLLSLALIAGVIQPAAEAGPLEEAEQFHTETLHRFEETLAATKAVKTRLNSRLSGKLLQGLLETIISEEELSAPFEKSGSRLMELHQKFEKAYEEVRQGTMSFADFRHSGWELLTSGLRDRFSLVLESARREMELLRQQNSTKAKAFAKSIQDGTPRSAVQPQEQRWFEELARAHQELAAYLKSEHTTVEDQAEEWGESGDDVSKALFSQLVEDELAIHDGPLAFGLDSSFQQFLDSQRWDVTPVALDRGVSLDLSKALQQVAAATHAEEEKERPDYPITFSFPLPMIYGVEQFGDGIPRKASNEYWTKEHSDLTAQERLGGFDILLVVYGRHLKERIGTTPEVSPVGVDSPAYKFLTHCRIKEQGYYTFCSHEYIPLFKEFREILEKKKAAGQKTPAWDGMDAYIVKATISPTCSSGQRSFKLGPVEIPWVQPFSRNVAGVGCFRTLPAAAANDPSVPPVRADMQQPLRWGFESDHVVFQIATSAPIPEGTKIRFHLVKKTADGETPVKVGGREFFEAQRVATAERLWLNVPGETFSALYRSEPFVLGSAELHPSGGPPTVPLTKGEILVAKILWPGPVREIVSSALEFHTSPAEIGFTFTEALLKAAAALKLPAEVSYIPGAPPRARDEAIARLAARKAGKVSANGTFIDFSSEKYGSADAEYEVNVGEIAVLLMLREHMIAAGELGLKKYRELFKEVEVAMTPHDLSVLPGPYLALDKIRAMVLTSAPNSPLGQAFRNYYPEPAAELLKRYDWQWRKPVPARIHEGAVYVEPELREFLAKSETSLTKLKKTDARNPVELFNLVALGAESWTPLMAGQFVRLRETDTPQQQQWWLPDPLAPALLQSVAGKAQAIVDKQKQSDAYDGAVSGIYSPMGLLFGNAKGLLALAGVGLDLILAADMVPDIHEYYSRGAALEYTESMAVLTGGQLMWTRLQGQGSLSKPGWITALGVFGNTLGVAANAFLVPRLLGEAGVQIREYKTLARNLPRELVLAAALHGSFAGKPPLQQAAMLEEINRVASAAKRGSTLTAEETQLLESAAGFLTRIEKATLDDLARRPAEITSLMNPERRIGSSYFSLVDVPAESLADGRRAMEIALAGNRGGAGDEAVMTLFRLLHEQREAGVLPPQVMNTAAATQLAYTAHLPRPNSSWRGYAVGRFLGNGVYSFVYKMGDDLAVKIGCRLGGLENADTYARVVHGSDLLAQADVPQIALRLDLSREFEDTFAMVQELVPEGSILLRGKPWRDVLLEGPTGTPLDLIASRRQGIDMGDLMRQQRGLAQRGAEPVVDATSVPGAPMPTQYAEAVMKLYKKLVDHDLVWPDGHLGNIVFVKTDDEWVAKVLDADFIWKFGRNFRTEGPVARTTGGGYMDLLYYHDVTGTSCARLQSMYGSKISQAAFDSLEAGRHIAPSAEFLMLKVMELHGFIHWDRVSKRWLNGTMQVKDVEKFFPSINNREWIDPDFGKLFHGAVILPSFRASPGGLRTPAMPRQLLALAA